MVFESVKSNILVSVPVIFVKVQAKIVDCEEPVAFIRP